jgi:hypothetical protein
VRNVVPRLGEATVDYPRWSDRLIRQIDTFVARRSRAKNVPALVLTREVGGDVRAPAFLVREYEHRLTRGSGRSLFQVPHAVIDDAELSGGFIAAIDQVALRFQMTVPSGGLRLPAFHTCRAVLDLERGTGDLRSQQKPILDGLHAGLLQRWGVLRVGARVADFFGQHFLTGWLQGLVAALVVGVPKVCYRLYLRQWGLRWVADEVNAAGFLDASLAFCRDSEWDREDPRVRRILLRALLADLRKATTRTSYLSHRWARRRWAFVVLIPEIDEVNGPGRTFLGTFEELAGEVSAQALLILAACVGPPPDYAVPIGADLGRPNGIADKIFTLLSEGSDDPVRLISLPAEDDDAEHTARTRLATHPSVNARRDRIVDWLRPISLPFLAALSIVALVAAQRVGPVTPAPPPPSCITVATGERVGVTDGSQCSLAVAGERGDELRALEKKVATQNALVSGGVFRSIVLLAPLSLQNGVSDSPPTGLQVLRGAIAQQYKLNRETRQNQMPIRLLIANTGQYFQYGARNRADPSAPDVAQMIIDRQQRDQVAAVVGLTQSRPQSLQAAQELDRAGIPVIANGVTGSIMVGPKSPPRYFQISAPNQRITPVLVNFLRNSPAIQSLTSPKPHAVVVYDPTDTYFSTDLRNQFVRAYRKYDSNIDEITYSEKPGVTTPTTIATAICERVAATDGIVVYLGRSGVLPNLLIAMQGAGRSCHPPLGTSIPLITESSPIEFQTEPNVTAQRFPYMSLFYVTANAPTQDYRDPYAQFTHSFADIFKPLGPDADASGGFDTVGIVTHIIEDLLPNARNSQVAPNDIYVWLTAQNAFAYPGASGVLQLGGQHKFPPDKAVYIRQIQPDGKTTTLLSCGVLPDTTDPSHWGPNLAFTCPRDQT